MHIAVAGNIGSGKSTLTRLLAKHYGWEPWFESVDNNPYLEDYYRDIHRWSFNMEVFFLKERCTAPKLLGTLLLLAGLAVSVL